MQRAQAPGGSRAPTNKSCARLRRPARREESVSPSAVTAPLTATSNTPKERGEERQDIALPAQRSQRRPTPPRRQHRRREEQEGVDEVNRHHDGATGRIVARHPAEFHEQRADERLDDDEGERQRRAAPDAVAAREQLEGTPREPQHEQQGRAARRAVRELTKVL